jgi:ABC-type Mn2+/Zn2+ transport system permease subunit
VATALWLGGSAAAQRLSWLESDATAATLAVAASVATAWLVARGGETRLQSTEGVTGWVFLLAASVPVLMLANSAHGLEEIQRLMFSTLLSASGADLVLFLALAVATVLATLALHPRLMLFSMDPEMAAAAGMRRRVWRGAMALWLGVAVGLSMRTAGMLYAFGCLVLPALIARNLCREVRPMLLAAPGIALGAALLGFSVAHGFDLPPAHTTIGLLCLGLPAAWAVRALRALGARSGLA